jgi:hypothetical protein
MCAFCVLHRLDVRDRPEETQVHLLDDRRVLHSARTRATGNPSSRCNQCWAHPTQHSYGMTTTRVLFHYRSKRKHACSSSSLEPRCSGWFPRILSKQPCDLLLSCLVGYWAYFCSSFIPASFPLNSFIITVAAHSPLHHKTPLRCQPSFQFAIGSYYGSATQATPIPDYCH